MKTLLLVLITLSTSFGTLSMNQRIETSIAESYIFNKYLQNEKIKINVFDGGKVVLLGVVSEGVYKSLAEETLIAIAGVKTVENKIEVMGEQPKELTDMWIRLRVKSMLTFHKSVEGSTINVTILDGVITLSGKATSMTQRNIITEYALDIEGVKDVKNLLTIPTNYVTKIDTSTISVDDASIAALVTLTFKIHKSTQYLNVKVEVFNGIVELTGTVNYEAQKERLTALANDIYGARVVNNNMVVEINT